MFEVTRMYLASIKLKNFRKFDEQEHVIHFQEGLNVLVGENDAGKSAIIDAIRIALGTTDSNNFSNVNLSDFYQEDLTRIIEIVCYFKNLTEKEESIFLEYLTYEEEDREYKTSLYLHWNYGCIKSNGLFRPIALKIAATGRNGDGDKLSNVAREELRVTYLKPLRDASIDLRSGRRSRLPQIIHGLPGITDGEDNYQDGVDPKSLSLVGIFNLANILLEEHKGLNNVNKEIEKVLSEKMLLRNDNIKTKFEVSDSGTNDEQKVARLLEKLELVRDKSKSHNAGNVGLGTSNIISMACEMLLHQTLAKRNRSSFLLIEEPEAHVHAQRQLKLIQSLNNNLVDNKQQIIITTHSPLLASVVALKNVLIVKDANVYSLAPGNTKLEADDYRYLEAYLDATKANLFFARSVLIVEGPGEELLFPTLARLLGHSLTDYGCSLVDVRSTGLRRFARIFQRENENEKFNIPVACVTDKDIMPNCAPRILFPRKGYKDDGTKWPREGDRRWRAERDYEDDETQIEQKVEEIKNRADGQTVRTFVADQWTLEYDLAYYGLVHDEMAEILMRSLIKVAYKENNRDTYYRKFAEELDSHVKREEKATCFYKRFTDKKVSKAEFAQELAFALEESYKDSDATALRSMLPPYIVDAINYVTEGLQ